MNNTQPSTARNENQNTSVSTPTSEQNPVATETSAPSRTDTNQNLIIGIIIALVVITLGIGGFFIFTMDNNNDQNTENTFDENTQEERMNNENQDSELNLLDPGSLASASDDQLLELLADGEFGAYLETQNLTPADLLNLTDEEIEELVGGYTDYIFEKIQNGEELIESEFSRQLDQQEREIKTNGIVNAVGLNESTTLRDVDFKITSVTDRGAFIDLNDGFPVEEGYDAERDCTADNGRILELTIEVTNNMDEEVSGIFLNYIVDRELENEYPQAVYGFICNDLSNPLSTIAPGETAIGQYSFDVTDSTDDLYLEISDAFFPFSLDVGDFAYIDVSSAL